MVFWVPILAYVAVVLLTALSFLRAPSPRGPGLVARLLLRYVCLVPLGLMGLWGALGHLVFPAQSAAAIGWATSPFQTEVGLTNLGIGVAGVIGAFYADRGYRLALAVMSAGFLGGAGINHIVEIARSGNMAAGNAGPILYTDLLTPLLLFILLAMTPSERRAGA